MRVNLVNKVSQSAGFLFWRKMKRTDIGLVSCNYENWLIHKVNKEMKHKNRPVKKKA